MTTAQTSFGPSLILTQSEATAAQRTWAFHLVKSADSTDATGLTPVMTISKAGAAFAAVDAATAITELTNGWYKVVQAAADIDTLGMLAYRIAVATADTINNAHQVTALDLNVAGVAVAAGGIVAASFASDATALLGNPLVSSSRTFAVSANGDTALSMVDCTDAVIQVTGTFGGGSAQVQTTENPTVVSPVWTNSGSALTANGSVTVTGPHNAVRVHLTGATTPALSMVFTVRKPQSIRP